MELIESGQGPSRASLVLLLSGAALVLLLVAVVFGRGEWQSPLELPRRSLLFLLLSGVATGVSWLCWFRAIQLGPLARVAPIDKLSVVIVAALGVVLLGESLSPWQWLGVALMGGGAVLLAWP
jgi:transporter family protein